jgi:glycosyltransferase involved in cell wall biosynthesis
MAPEALANSSENDRLLTVLFGQPDVYSTSFQTTQLSRALESWFRVEYVRLPEDRHRWQQTLRRVAVNYLVPLITRPQADWILYANDGAVDLSAWKGRKILYWYDAPWNWLAEPPLRRQWIHHRRYRNVMLADYVFAVSDIQVKVARGLRPGRESSVTYLPVGVDCAVFDPNRASPQRVRDRFRLPPRLTIGYLGYLGKYGGKFAGEILMDVAPALLQSHDVHFLIVGFGPALKLWKDRVCALGLDQHFTFTGYVENDLVPDCIAAMDICVDTLEDGFHSEARSETKLKQYMAMGRACIATAIGENRIDLDGGKCGLLPATGSEPLLRDLRILCDQSSLRHELGAAARNRAQQVYDWQKLAARMTKVLFDA